MDQHPVQGKQKYFQPLHATETGINSGSCGPGMALRLHTFYLKWRLGNIYETHVVTCTFTRIILIIWKKYSVATLPCATDINGASSQTTSGISFAQSVGCDAKKKREEKKTVHKVSRSYFFSSRLYCFHFAHVPQFLLELWPPKIISCTKYVTFLLFLPPVTYTDYRGVCYSYTQFRVCLFLYET